MEGVHHFYMFVLVINSSKKIILLIVCLIIVLWRNCIIDKNARIGKNVTISNSEVCIISITPSNMLLCFFSLKPVSIVENSSITWSTLIKITKYRETRRGIPASSTRWWARRPRFEASPLLIIWYCGCLLGLKFQGVQEADRTSEGFYIRSGITIVLKNSIIADGLVIWGGIKPSLIQPEKASHDHLRQE